MTDDRPIPPEDEGLPEWLRGFDLPPDDDRPAGPPPQRPVDSLDFLRDVGGEPQPGIRDTATMKPVSSGAPPAKPGRKQILEENDDLPTVEELRGITATLPWMRDLLGLEPPPEPAPAGELPPSPPEPAADELDWMAFEAEAEQGAPGALPDWLAGAELDMEQPPSEEPPAPPRPRAELPDWLAGMEEEILPLEPGQAAIPTGKPEAPPAWAIEQPAMPPVEDSDLSYEEWERLQEEAGREPTEAEKLAEEVPEWFEAIAEGELPPAEQPPAAAEAAGPEFMPDWYLGLEEQEQAQKPAWFSAIDYSPDALTAEPVIPEKAPEPEPSLEDIPDWFAEAEAPATPPEPGPEVPASAEIPDWFAEAEAPAAPPAPEPEAPSEEEVPDWFAQAEGLPTPEAPAAAEVPDWFAEIGLTPSQEADWMADLQAAAPEEEQATPPPPAGEPAPPETPVPEAEAPRPVHITEPPAWLGDLPFELERAPAEAEAPPPQPPAEPVEEFMQLIEEKLGEVEAPAPLATGQDALVPLEQAEFDLDELFAVAELPPEEEAVEQAPPPGAEITATQLPDWLAGVQVGGFSAVRQVMDVGETPLEELSERLRALREHTLAAAEAAPPPSPAPTTPALDGITDGLAPATVFDNMAGREMILETRLDERQAARVATLSSLLGVGEEAVARDAEGRPVTLTGAQQAVRIAEAARRARARSRVKPARVLVTLALLAALVLPFLVDVSALLPLPPAALDPASHGTLDAAIEELDERSQVLVGFEYGPTAAGEMDALTRALLTHVLLRGARPVIVSTNPAGVLQARNVLADLAADPFILARRGRTAALTMPDDYVILSYLPGGVVGLRALTATSTDASALDRGLFAVDLEGRPTGLDIRFLQTAFDLALVFGERGEDVRLWVEQVGAAVKLPLGAAVAAGAEPVARPYLTSGQLIGLLAGYRDAYSYDAVLRSALAQAGGEAPGGRLTTGTPVPSPTPSPTPTQRVTATPTSTPADEDLTATALASGTPTVIPSATPRVIITATPVPTQVRPAVESQAPTPIPPPPAPPERDTRWYSMTLGVLAAGGLIGLGALVNFAQWIRRRREP
ncbi:MAG: hypothetical protein HPY64_10905 [Anaerolineae bacterium]|nr:hypothetical protein [Anaerolineae bacterium]